MKILVLEDIASSTFGGAEQTMRAFCERLALEGHELHLVYDRPGDYSQNVDGLYASVTRVSTLPLLAQPTYGWTKSVLTLARVCRAHNIDLILTHVVHSVSMLRVVNMMVGVRIAVYFKWVCDTDTVGAQATWGLKAVDRSAAVSRFVADYWVRNGLPAKTLDVVPEGISMRELDEGAGSASISTGDTSGKKSFDIGFAGRIVPEKGLQILLDAVAGLSKRGLNARCFVAGKFEPETNSFHASLRAQTERLGISDSVKFLGYVAPLAGLFSDMDVVAVPSLCQDAQPIVLMQAMALGIPVVATRVGGIPELLPGDLSRLTCEPENVTDLEDLLLSVSEMPSDKRRSLAETLRSRTRADYSLDQSHRRLMSALRIA